MYRRTREETWLESLICCCSWTNGVRKSPVVHPWPSSSPLGWCSSFIYPPPRPNSSLPHHAGGASSDCLVGVLGLNTWPHLCANPPVWHGVVKAKSTFSFLPALSRCSPSQQVLCGPMHTWRDFQLAPFSNMLRPHPVCFLENYENLQKIENAMLCWRFVVTGMCHTSYGVFI
jgi:hypothetical protein